LAAATAVSGFGDTITTVESGSVDEGSGVAALDERGASCIFFRCGARATRARGSAACTTTGTARLSDAAGSVEGRTSSDVVGTGTSGSIAARTVAGTEIGVWGTVVLGNLPDSCVIGFRAARLASVSEMGSGDVGSIVVVLKSSTVSVLT
jgi:hypothetical protein